LGSNLKSFILDEKVIEAIDHKLLQELFPSELMDYFTI